MRLEKFFKQYNKVALGFSGGVDSSYLLYVGKKYKVDIQPYFIKTDFQPDFELEDALKIGQFLNVKVNIINYSIFNNQDIIKNNGKRCYYCKKSIFSKLIQEAEKDGYYTIIDGTNASDNYLDRPGMRALEELNVISPLRNAGLTKKEIRQLSEEANLFTYKKPSYSCLGTRIATGKIITKKDLEKIEKAENFLFSLGFENFRIRLDNSFAKIEVQENQFNQLIIKREEILKEFENIFDNIYLDLIPRKYFD